MVRVKFFASLREEAGRGEVEVDPEQAKTAADAWRIATDGRPFPERALVAINLDYVDADAPIRSGDEVAFFPPVTGG
ncbi:MAG: MoaD/ThiS family protein [Ectothiorhodospiraceae bacterium AqS1]|nr:MoaD/ThiS family protein [Ectothiorhodospiraceae bacterium AqS1]